MDDPVVSSSSPMRGTWRSLLVDDMREMYPSADQSFNSESQTSCYSVHLEEEVRNRASEELKSETQDGVKETGASSSKFRPRSLLGLKSGSNNQRSSSTALESASSGAVVPYKKKSSNEENNNSDDAFVEEAHGAFPWSTAPVHWTHKLWHKWQLLRFTSGKIVNNAYVQQFIVVLIALNALMMGIATFHFVTDNPQVTYIFETIDLICLIIFTIELGMQFLYTGWRLFLDGWLVFDFVVIVMSWSFQQVQIIRAFRIFRALRLITRVKVMKNLVLALFGVMPRMFAIALLLMLVSYIFAVMCTQLFKGLYPTYTDEDYWGRLDYTFFSLFQIMTLDNWTDITRQTMVAYSYAWLPIIVFVIISGFVVVNLIIAVICDAISALHEDDKAKLHGSFAEDEGEDDENAGADSMHPALQDDVRQQLTVLETHVEELSKMQEETMLTLQMLAASVAEHRARQKRLATSKNH